MLAKVSLSTFAIVFFIYIKSNQIILKKIDYVFNPNKN